MKHLLDDEIMLLASIEEEGLFYTDDELVMMEHLKICRSCYEKFCAMLTVLEVTGEQGYLVFSELYDLASENTFLSKTSEKLLAAVNFARDKIAENLDSLFQQTDQREARLNFIPSLAMATRGAAVSEKKIYKLEDIHDEKTFIVIDSAKNELLLQVNTKVFGEIKVAASIVLESGEQIEIPMEVKGKLYKGIMKNLPMESFQIVIVQIE